MCKESKFLEREQQLLQEKLDLVQIFLQYRKKQREQETLEESSEEEMDEDSDDEGSENEMDEDSDDEGSENEMDEDSDDDDHLDRWEELRSHSKDTA